ncbi:MAG: Pycsar system effector family protein [Gammaproteobacteria bacterium]
MSNIEALRLAVQILENLNAQIRATEDPRALRGLRDLRRRPDLDRPTGAVPAQIGRPPDPLDRLCGAPGHARVLLDLGGPRAAPAPDASPGRRALTLFYFGDIHGMEPADYVRAFMGLSAEDALDQVLTQVHVNAKIVQKKYLWTRRAATGFVAATVVWLAVQLAFWFP